MNLIYDTALIPIIRVESADTAFKVADAFLEGGVNIIEVTFSVPGAAEVVEELTAEIGDDVLVGTGTVLDAETARKAILAGSEFIVSPIYSRELIETSRRYAKPCIPGALTPTEILDAYTMGADAVKVFPNKNLGGASYIKAVRAPLPQVPLVPTGGVNLENAGSLLEAGSFALGVGSAITDKQAIREANFDVITKNVEDFLSIISKYRQ
ncbi:MAG: bifunctional 4-hydroxy-2-oxoglutarate aldolase/2-dehydro-3-deoxy-phosphogluconate aldolase [Candidatus Lokiarchaeota archaeon]|nr:bifunctional 4-hydroxy-2-oxoglutarate aldolase/2-dehydro-3-deoxy-phosphogluconate aldolase [Candidatus Lokiarchaeota archaeon]